MRAIRVRQLATFALPLMATAVICLMWSPMAGANEEKAGWLGVSLQRLTPSLREAMDVTSDAGVLITEVAEDSPADKAGFQEGDVIVRYQETDVTSPHRLMKMVRQTEPGTKVNIVVSRKGQKKTLTAQIGELDTKDECQLKILMDDDGEDFFMDFDEDAFVLGLPGLSGLLMEQNLWLGIKPISLSDQLAEYFHVKDGRGVLISEVISDSPAEKVGLKTGDVIVRVDDERVEDAHELRETIEEHEEGDDVTVAVVRDGKEKTFRTRLEKSPEKEKLAITKKLEKWPQKIKKFRLKVPSEELMDVHIEKILAEEELEELEERLKQLEEELEKIQEKLEMK